MCGVSLWTALSTLFLIKIVKLFLLSIIDAFDMID